MTDQTTEPPPTKKSILAKLQSRDSHQIWDGSYDVLKLHDRKLLSSLAPHVHAILSAAAGIELGGMLRPNRLALEAAIRKINYAADTKRCLCGFYPTWDLSNPDDEEEKGAVTIFDSEIEPDAGWNDCECTNCKSQYRVFRNNGHYDWWTWVPKPAAQS